MRAIIFGFTMYLAAGCSTSLTKSRFGFKDVASAKPSITRKKTILDTFGQPYEKEILPRGSGSFEGALEYWGFKKGKGVRLHVTFSSEILQSIAYDIHEEDPEYDLSKLLGKLDGQFQIVKEPVRNPHAMPTKCYLVDEKRGISVLVNANKRVPIFVSFWNSKVGKNRKWFDVSGPEFCIVGHCSRVSDSKAWKHNHCKWLEALTKKK